MKDINELMSISNGSRFLILRFKFRLYRIKGTFTLDFSHFVLYFELEVRDTEIELYFLTLITQSNCWKKLTPAKWYINP